VPAAEVKRGAPAAPPAEWMQRSARNAPGGNGSGDKAGAVTKQGERSRQGEAVSRMQHVGI